MSVIPISSAARFAAATTSDAGSNTLILPVAPHAVCRLRHIPESKASQALSPAEALMEVERHKGLEQLVLDGPGDPLASMATTLETLTLLKKHYPALSISLITLGLGGEQHAAELAAAGLNSITLLVETMEAATAEKLYAWIRPGKKTLPLSKVVPLLLEEQPKTVQAMAAAGVAVALRTTIYPGINAHQVVMIAETMAELGAKEIELVPFFPDPQQDDAPPPPTRVHMEQIGLLTGRYLATTSRQIMEEDCGCSSGCGCGVKTPVLPGLPKPSAERPRVAVVSTTGMDVDLHLGQAKTLLIYGPRDDGLTCLLETRQASAAGSGETRWVQLAETLHDCFALLAASAGQRPREVLGSLGIRVIVTEENIEGTVDVLYGGGKKQKCGK